MNIGGVHTAGRCSFFLAVHHGEEEQGTGEEDWEMEETLDDWLLASGRNPFDLDTRVQAIRDPFGSMKDE